MTEPPPRDTARRVTRALEAIEGGEREASDELFPLVYDDLRRLAAARMARLSPGQTLQATDLVHDAYLRLVGPGDRSWDGRAHFFGAAARAMRHVVADHLQRKGSLKRGGHYQRVGEDTAAGLGREGPSLDVLVVEEALTEFEREHPRQAEVVTMMFYGGLTQDEAGVVLGVSSRTIERDWSFARAWLNGRLGEWEAEA